MKLNQEQIKHIAKLARLKLTDEEVDKFATQLTGIISWIDMLQEVNVDGVVPTSQVTGLTSEGRPDVVIGSSATREELLGCSELPKEARQVKVKSVM